MEISVDIAMLHYKGLLNGLLADKTTGGNITWATNEYEERGPKFAPDAPILPELIVGAVPNTIQIRAEKPRDEQRKRTRTKGEVFTPISIIKKMNAHILEDAHNNADDWKQFIEYRMLEITCGEGPFLVTRYDTETGKYIPLKERVGLLDAKLREVTKHSENIHTWIAWAIRAYQTTYGYEYQGDSLLIARVNMIKTFIDYYQDAWEVPPCKDLLYLLSVVISWNIWQMDGLTGKTPNGIECQVFDWRANEVQKWPKPPHTKKGTKKSGNKQRNN